MNKTIYRIMLCLSVCALLLLVFIGCNDQSDTKNDPVVTTEKVYEYEYQKVMEENGFVLAEDAVQVYPIDSYETYPSDQISKLSTYKKYFGKEANEATEEGRSPYLVIGEKMKTETYVRDYGSYICRCPIYDIVNNEYKYTPHVADHKYIVTVTTIRVDEIVEDYFSKTDLSPGMYIHLEEITYALKKDTLFCGGNFYKDQSEHKYEQEYRYFLENGTNAIPDGKCLFYIEYSFNDLLRYENHFSSCLINNEDAKILEFYRHSFISLEKNLMTDDYRIKDENGEIQVHKYIIQAQADYADKKGD